MAFDSKPRLTSVPASDAFASLKREPLLRRLEPRIMFDAAALETAIDALHSGAAPDQHFDAPHYNAPDTLPDHVADTALSAADLVGLADHMDGAITVQSMPNARSVVFIDANVPDLAVLEAAIADTSDIVVLDPAKDGLAQMAAYLADRHDLDAIHIISHGEPGKLHLGSSTYDAGTLKAFDAELTVIGASLHQGGDILIYGCDVAQGTAGDAFVHKFADLTHADVAGSTDLTGSVALGGNWVLEDQVGVVESTLAISAPGQSSYLNTLDLVVTPATTSAGVATIFTDTFVGDGITATNFVQTGSNTQFGTFTNDADGFGPSRVPLTDGVIFATGDVSTVVVPGLNTNNGFTDTTIANASVPELVTLTGGPIFDAAAFGFNFTATTDRIGFIFSFASDEYPEYVGTPFNDGFGFFIQGGTDYVTKTNLALVPGTTDGIAVNTVNSGSAGSQSVFYPTPFVATNSAYYIANHVGSSGYYLQYDGLTTLLQVDAEITRDTTYSMKIAIGDAGDRSLDSGVFFKTQGFLALTSATDNDYATT